MLSRTADNLFWLSRYVERADYLARILDAATRLSVLPTSYTGESNEWDSALTTAGCRDIFYETHKHATAETVAAFLAFAPENPFSIQKCLEMARFNARAVRTALTTEMWETINSAWLELKSMDETAAAPSRITKFTDWVKDVALRFEGSGYRTMLRQDGFWFSKLGSYIERADNTARILDVKYHILLPEKSEVGGGLDFSQWAAILRSVNALTSYHWVYRESIKPALIADLLIFNEALPRSLAACYNNILEALDELATGYGRQGAAQRLTRATRMSLENSNVEQVFQTGLHEFLVGFIADNNQVGYAISEQYLT